MAEKGPAASSQSQPPPPSPHTNSTAVSIVEDWLKSVDLVQYTQAFLDNGYDDLEVCKQIGEDDLEAIGVRQEHREKLTRAVKILKEEGGTAVYFTLEECDTCHSDNDTEVGDCQEDELSAAVGASNNVAENKFANIGNPHSNPKVFSAQYRGNSVDNSSRRLATFSRMQLQLILRDKLALGNIDLSSPPYTNVDQTLSASSVTALALRFSQDLNTHFSHVMDQLEELWYLATNGHNNGVYPSPSRSVYNRSQSMTYEPVNYPPGGGGVFRMHPPPLPSCPPPSTMSSSHHLPSRMTSNPHGHHQGHLRMDPMMNHHHQQQQHHHQQQQHQNQHPQLHQPTYVALDGDAQGNVIEEKKKGSGSVFGRFLRNFGLRRSARKAAYKQHQGDLNASEMSMGEEDRMALMLLVKEGKISTQDALVVVQRYEEGRKHSVVSLGAGMEGLGKENDTPSKKSGTGKKKKGSKPPKSQSSFSADDPNSLGHSSPPYNISSPQSPCEHMVCRRVHSLSQLDSGSNSNASTNNGGGGGMPPMPPHRHPPPLPHHHHPSSPGLEGNAAQADFLARDKLMLTRAVSCTPTCPPNHKLLSQGSESTMSSRLQSPHPGHYPHHPVVFQHAPHPHHPPLPQQPPLPPPPPPHHQFQPPYQQQPQHHQHQPHHHHHRHLNKVEAIRERLTGKTVNGVSKTSSKTSLLSSGSDQSMDYGGSNQLPLRPPDLLTSGRGGSTASTNAGMGDGPAHTYHSNSTVSMSSDNSPAPGRKKSGAGVPIDPRVKGNHRSASCSTGDDGISSENDDPEQRSRSRQQKSEESRDERDHSRKAHYVKEAHIYRPPLLRQTSAPTTPSPHNDRFLGQAMAVVDFTPGPEDDGFVPLKRGDVVNILNMAQSGVWRGVVNGRPGKFRFEHVEVVIEPGAPAGGVGGLGGVALQKVVSPTPTPVVPGQLDIPRSVADLLTKIGLESLTNLFVMNGYDDLDIFADLDDSDLDALHIQDVDHRKRLLSAAKVLTDWNEKQSRSQTPSIKAVDSPSSRAGNSSCDSGCYTGGATDPHPKHKGKKHLSGGEKPSSKDGKGKKGGPATACRTPCNSCGKPTKSGNAASTTPSPLVPHHPYYTPSLYYGYSGQGGLSYYPHSHNQLFSSSTLYHPSVYPRTSEQPASSSGSSMTTSATLTEMNMNITESSFVPPTHPHQQPHPHPYRDPRFNNLPSLTDGISLTEEDQEVIAITYGTHRRRKPSSASAQSGMMPSSTSSHSQFDLVSSSSAAGDLINPYIPSNSSTSSSIYRQLYDPYAYSSVCSDPNCSQCVAYASCSQCASASAYHHYVNTVNTAIRSDSKSSKMSYSSGCTQTTCLSPDQEENGGGSGSGVIVGNGGSGSITGVSVTTSPNRLHYQPPSSSSSYYHPNYYHHHNHHHAYPHYTNLHPHPPCTDCIPGAQPTSTPNPMPPPPPGKPGLKSPSLSLLTIQDNTAATIPTTDPNGQPQQSNTLGMNSTTTESTADPAVENQPPQPPPPPPSSLSSSSLSQPPPPSSSPSSTPTNSASHTSQPWPNQTSRHESTGIANLYTSRGRNPSPSSGKADSSYQGSQVKSPLRSLMPLVATKLSAERIELSVEPYSSQTGECAIPPLLVQRYSEELRQDLKTIALVMENIREKEARDKEKAYVRNDLLSESCTSAVELQISSVKDFMFSIGLPMYNGALAQAQVVTVEQLMQTKGPELEKMTGADSRHLQRISHALEWVQAKLNSPSHRAKTKGPVDKV